MFFFQISFLSGNSVQGMQFEVDERNLSRVSRVRRPFYGNSKCIHTMHILYLSIKVRREAISRGSHDLIEVEW